MTRKIAAKWTGKLWLPIKIPWRYGPDQRPALKLTKHNSDTAEMLRWCQEMRQRLEKYKATPQEWPQKPLPVVVEKET